MAVRPDLEVAWALERRWPRAGEGRGQRDEWTSCCCSLTEERRTEAASSGRRGRRRGTRRRGRRGPAGTEHGEAELGADRAGEADGRRRARPRAEDEGGL